MVDFQAQLRDLKARLSDHLQPWHRSLQFWIRAADIYTGYKVCQLKAGFMKDAAQREAMWEEQHERAADKMYFICSDLGGLFLKAAQLLGKPDLAPAAWVRRLITLCDKAPATPLHSIQHLVEEELGRNFCDIFESFDTEPIGSASIAQVHRARLKSAKMDVAVKVQHPGVQYLMMVDIRNLQSFVLFLQKTDIKFDLFSLTKEIEKQIGHEFDFLLEARAMKKIQNFLQANNKNVPVIVPSVINDMVTRKLLVMELIDGVPIMELGNEIGKRGIDPAGSIATAAKLKILKDLTLAYGQMILKDGFFHADPHPGNILICKDSKVGLLDYGQVNHLPEKLRLGYANLVLGIADNDPCRVMQSYNELGIQISSTSDCLEHELLKLASGMFDTRVHSGATIMSPFSKGSALKKIYVQSFPEELFSVLRTMQLLRGLSVGMGLNFSCAEQWRPIAEEALWNAGPLRGDNRPVPKSSFLRRIFWRKGS